MGDKYRVIIGLDFGTTYSGIAYAFSTKPDQIYSITEWPGAQGRSVPKTPTVLKYNGNNKFQWGYELDRTIEEKIVGIKLLLDPEQERPLFDSAGAEATQAELKKLGKPPVGIASDYIAAIYKHAMEKIGGKVPKDYLAMLDKQFVLSVPAVWSDKAKDTTLRAAQNAGITSIELIKEPEAAALFTLNQLKNQGLSIGDAITICDAGGGTVHLVSYEITQLHPLMLKELAPSTGGIAGSMMINRRFEDFIKSKVGERSYVELKETNGWRHAMKNFDENRMPYINFPMANIRDDPSRGIKANTITVTAVNLYGIFEPVFKEIDRLVGEQINKVQIKRLQDKHPKGADTKAIFLVGGFGSSLFLRDAIAKVHPDIQVIQPNNAWSVIVQGAVLSKLPQEATVVSSVAERHYGVAGGEKFESLRDARKEEDKYWDSLSEIFRISRMSCIDFAFFMQLPPNAGSEQMKTTYELLMCSSDTAPDYPDKRTVTKNCSLNVNLSIVPRELWKQKIRVSDDQPYQTLDFKLLVKVEGARMAFSFECGGKEYAAVTTEY
ncbi:hypothetical protein GQ44DRAFT_746602 [Phaeosphaeriaceae sp. PMI808]|nr:hypothetical protein GQ44DRAFT_746602 [Phaeosphaeriaceae sp. PMI808]